MIIVVATDSEYALVKDLFPCRVIKTGVGYGNVYKSLAHIDRDEFILNVGYAGSNCLKIGSAHLVGEVRNYHPKVQYVEPTYKLCGSVPCYSSSDFVTETDITEPSLWDMELYAICSMGFFNVACIKIVSDNLNLQQYKENAENV